MAIHADIWLPVDGADPNGQMLRCEAWALGHLSGAGFAMSCSSARIGEIIALSALFGGSPFMIDAATRAAVPMDAARALESLAEAFHGDPPGSREVADIAVEALALAQSGDAAGALASKLGLIPLARKLSEGWSGQARILPMEQAWARFLGGAAVHAAPEAAKLLADSNLARGAPGFDFDEAYFWRDGRFWAAGGRGALRACVPLIQACAVAREEEALGDFEAYLPAMTHADREDLFALIDEMAGRGFPWRPWEGVFDQGCSPVVKAMVEARDLSAALPQEKSSRGGSKGL